MLGTSGVGKTALTAQFMTSEYLNTYEASLGIICFSIFYEGAHRGIFDRFQSVLSIGNLVDGSHPKGKRKQDKHQESLLFFFNEMLIKTYELQGAIANFFSEP